MFTQCRGCGEKFILEVEQLIHARGQVRCNMCGTVFDALETLSKDKPLEDEDFLLHDFDNAPPLLTQVFDMEIEPDEDVLQVLNDLLPDNLIQNDQVVEDLEGSNVLNDSENEENSLEGDSWEGAKQQAENVILDEEEGYSPIFSEDKVKKVNSNSGSGIWSLLSVFMLGMILWQVTLVLQDGSLSLPKKPWATSVCEWISCAKTKQKVDLGAISLVSRNIRPHPGRDEALMISASMINANEKSVNFPILEIKLSDLSGQVVAMRRFLPEEYVSEEIVSSGFVQNTLVPFSLEIASPGERAVAFEIGFVQP